MNILLNLRKNPKCICILSNHRLIFNILFKNSKLSIHLTKLPQVKNKEETLAQLELRQKYDCVYEFRYIRQLRLFSRMKIYQSVLSVLFGISSLSLYEMNYINDLNTIITINATMAFAVLMLFIISRQTVKFVGKMYINPEKNRILISHLNFLGNRRDFEIDIDKVESLDSIQALNDIFFKLKMNDFDGFMLMSLRLGKLHDKENFKKIFKLK
jgi:hypothetical protein